MRDGLYYCSEDSQHPFTGEVFEGPERGRIEQGKRVGTWLIFNKNEQLEQKRAYNNGKLEGYAEAIEMECRKAYEGDLTHYKYEGPLFGKAKVFYREDGRWREIPGARVGERSAVREATFDRVADKDYGGSNLKKGDEYQQHVKWVFDFAFFKYTRTFYLTKMDGSPLVPGEEGHDRAKPEIKELLCKKPDESWADRQKR
ncbi:MAG: hypothetical protein VW771_11275 [Gammaproteobacteria bacterium]